MESLLGRWTIKGRLCIVGGGVTRSKAPFDSDAEIWSTASVGQDLPRIDACFELHGNKFSADVLNGMDCIVYMKEVREDVRLCERFPIEVLLDRFGKRLNGTVVMMLAYAIILGHKDIELYGIDFSSDEEYGRRNFFYWMMGYATAQGCSIKIAEGGHMSDTCRTYMYEDDGNSALDDMLIRSTGNIDAYTNQIRQYEIQTAYEKGIRDTAARLKRRT